jgi:hypothetical protein
MLRVPAIEIETVCGCNQPSVNTKVVGHGEMKLLRKRIWNRANIYEYLD